jgi:hypothetical protein
VHAGARSKMRSSRLPQVLLETVTSRTQLKLRPGLLQLLHQGAVGAQAVDQVATAASCAWRRSASSSVDLQRPSRRSARPFSASAESPQTK